MDIEDKELFDATLTDDVSEIEAPAEPEAQIDGQPRDDHGRFAPKAAEPEAQPEPQAAKEEVHVPSWRLREEREAREATERRLQEAETRWQRQYAELQAKLPKQEPKPAPDMFENPNGFLEHGVKQHVDPIRSEVQQTREFFSRMMAEEKHGAEKVQAAYGWIEKGMASGDPEAISAYQRAMQSMHPYGELVKAHQQRSVFEQIGSDPQAWFEKQLEERLTKDQAFAGNLLQKIQQSARPNSPQAEPKINLPPSLNRISSAQLATDDDGDMSDGALFRHATR